MNKIIIKTKKFAVEFNVGVFAGDVLYLSVQAFALLECWDEQAFLNPLKDNLLQAGYEFLPVKEAKTWWKNLTVEERKTVFKQEEYRFSNREYLGDKEQLYCGFTEDEIGGRFAQISVPFEGQVVEHVWSKKTFQQGIFLVRKL